MKTSLTLLVLAIFSITAALSQTNENTLLPTVLPSSPTAFEFLKYGDVPVGKYTGVPNIGVPIYVINAKGLDIPISLSYHSNGFRVNEEAGSTGLGWTLNAGGSVVQTVVGFDDFGYYKSRALPDIQGIVEHSSNGNTPSGVLSGCTGTLTGISEGKFLLPSDGDGSCNSGPQYDFPNDLFNGEKDFEPDVFHFNALGYYAKFVFNWDTETFVCLTDNKIKITDEDYVPGSSYPPTIFTIHVPDGHKFVFELKEESKFLVQASSPGSITNLDLVFRKEKASRTYKLTKIYTNKNDIIDFNYIVTNPIKNYGSVSKTHRRHKALQGWGMPSAPSPYEKTSYTLTEQPFSYLSSITFNKGKLVFSNSERTDIIGAKKLDKIEILSHASSTNFITLKTFNFNYSYFIGHNNGTKLTDHSNYNQYFSQKTTQEQTYRLKLNSVTELGKNPYTFEYNNEALPNKISLATDYWGYYNGQLNNQTLYANLYRFNIEVGNSNYSSHGNNNKSASEQHCKAGVLEKIIYPTLGYSTFEYELNKFDNYFVPNMDQVGNGNGTNPNGSFGAGLRITKTENFNHDNLKLLSKSFTYTGGKLMSPIIYFNEAFVTKYDFHLSHPAPPGFTYFYGRGYRQTLSSSNFLVPSSNASGKYVGYDEVTEHFISNQNSSYNIGKITDKYINNPDTVPFASGGNSSNWSQNQNGVYRELNFPTVKSTPNNGLVLEQRIYSKDDNINPIQKTEHKYNHFKGFLCVNGVKMGSLIKKEECDTHAPIYNSTYALGVYSYQGGYSYKDKTITTKYFDGTPVVTTENYSYNSYNQLINSTVTDSNNNLIEIAYQHPIDNAYPEFPESIYMLSYNSFTPVLKKEVKLNNNLVSIEKNNYERILTSNPFPVFSQKSFANGKTYSSIETKYSVNSFDDFGNALEVSRPDGIPICYVYGYDKRYPIAKIENASYTNMTTSQYIAISEAQLASNNDSYNTSVNENLLRYKLSVLKNTFPNAMVTTYTYDPLIGVTSITDPKGYIMYYEYDDFNRLKQVKDADGNILSKNEYNYKQ